MLEGLLRWPDLIGGCAKIVNGGRLIEANVANTTMGLCIEDALQPFRLRVSGNSGCITIRLASRPMRRVKCSPADRSAATLRDSSGGERCRSRASGVSLSRRTGLVEDSCLRLAASLAYYTALSLAPLVLLLAGVAGMVLGRERVAGQLAAQLESLMGQAGRELVTSILTTTNPEGGLWATIVSLVTLVIGATAVFGELQTAMNLIWEVQPPRPVGPGPGSGPGSNRGSSRWASSSRWRSCSSSPSSSAPPWREPPPCSRGPSSRS